MWTYDSHLAVFPALQKTSRTVYHQRTYLRKREMESLFLSYPLYLTSFDICMNYFPLLCFHVKKQKFMECIQILHSVKHFQSLLKSALDLTIRLSGDSYLHPTFQCQTRLNVNLEEPVGGGERVKLKSTCTKQQQITFLTYRSLVQIPLQSAGPQSRDHLVAQGSGELNCYGKSSYHPSWTSNQSKQNVCNSPLVPQLPALPPYFLGNVALTQKPQETRSRA